METMDQLTHDTNDSCASDDVSDCLAPAYWVYTNAQLTELERSEVFGRSWQLIGHTSQLKEPGDYITLDAPGIRVAAVLGDDCRIRAFYNMCPHRGFRLFSKDRGSCGRFVICPYHSWSFDVSGGLRGVPFWKADYPHVSKATHSLSELPVEVYCGLIFVRLGGDTPAMSAVLKPFERDIRCYGIEEMVIADEENLSVEVRANWKMLVENDFDKDHIRYLHPGLHGLVGFDIPEELAPTGAWRAVNKFVAPDCPVWSVNRYKKIVKSIAHLPDRLQCAVVNYNIFPNLSVYMFPDRIDFLQLFPLGPAQTVIVGRTLVHRVESREIRAARYLNGRFSKELFDQDVDAMEALQTNLSNGRSVRGALSRTQLGLLNFYKMLYARLPIVRLLIEPSRHTFDARRGPCDVRES
jgi:phenylpropionate dioxygenase-like ring-hydroxylating dioxygenase large terminal subunit